VTGGSNYTFSVWAKSPSASATVTPYGYVSWFDSASSTLDGYWVYPDNSSVGNDWTEISFGWATAPVGTTSATFYLAGYLNLEAGGILYDDASMSLIPEPVTMSLLGLGALMLRRRKK
jgi:hypothetical protein